MTPEVVEAFGRWVVAPLALSLAFCGLLAYLHRREQAPLRERRTLARPAPPPATYVGGGGQTPPFRPPKRKRTSSRKTKATPTVLQPFNTLRTLRKEIGRPI